MDALIEFGRGPLFKFSLAIMILGLLRILLLSLAGIGEALYRAGDRNLDYKAIWKKTVEWLVPVNRWAKMRPIYSSISILFHVGLLLVPLFLAGHLTLWTASGGLTIIAMPQFIADALTLMIIVLGPALLIGRIVHSGSRAISRLQDYLWPLLLTIPFFSGFLCVNFGLSSTAYNFWMLIHIWAADLILILIPFTKIAHCILMPLTQLVSGVGWKFPVGVGEKVAATLGKKGQPI